MALQYFYAQPRMRQILRYGVKNGWWLLALIQNECRKRSQGFDSLQKVMAHYEEESGDRSLKANHLLMS